MWQRVLSWEFLGSWGLLFPNLAVSISESLPGPGDAFGITLSMQLCCFCANTESWELAPRPSTVLCVSPACSAVSFGAVWGSLFRAGTPPCPSPPSESCTEAEAGQRKAFAAVLILPRGERFSGVRMAEMRCAISRGPIPLLRKGGQMRQSSSSTIKMGFVLCHSGIIGMGSVACTRQVRPCHQLCLCPAQQCGEFPESKECLPTLSLDFLPKHCSLGTAVREQTLNSCSVCLSLALKYFAASLRARALRCSCALAAVTGCHMQLSRAVGHPHSQENLSPVRQICSLPTLQASPSFLTLIINYLEAI